MKILVIDNNLDRDCWGAEDLRRLLRSFSGATAHVRRAPQEDLPRDASGFDRIVVSGSRTSCLADAPWIEKLLEFIRGAVTRGTPLLGVCYGHQALVRALGGTEMVRKSAADEYGWSRIEVLEDSPLLKGVGKRFYSFSAHSEEVRQLPRGMKRLARSEACEIQACWLEGKPVYGIQFHPEKDVSDA
ncbi:MAG: type 1 glutamine amidotransferase, partial [Bdellovibrionota bacterium]